MEDTANKKPSKECKAPPMVARHLTGLFLFCGGQSRGNKGMEYLSWSTSILLKEHQKLDYKYRTQIDM